jgi:hypothetical protein
MILFGVFTANAQTAETVDELTALPDNSLSFERLVRTVPKSEFGNIDLTITTEPIVLPDQTTAVVITIKTIATELVYEDIGGKPQSHLNVYGRITSEDKVTNGYFRERFIAYANPEDIAKSKKQPVTLRKVFRLKKGKYKLGVIFRDRYDRGIKKIKFEIP